MLENSNFRYASHLKPNVSTVKNLRGYKKQITKKQTGCSHKVRSQSSTLTSVDDAHGVGHIVGHVGSEPRPQLLMDLLSLDAHKHDKVTQTHT